MKWSGLRFVIVCSVLVGLAAYAHAVGNIRLTDDESSSENARVDIDVDGNRVVVWQDDRFGNYEILWRKFTASGVPLTGIVRVTDTALPSVRPDVDCDAAGASHVVWQEGENVNGVGTVYLCRLDPGGNKILEDTDVSSASGSARVSALPSGETDIVCHRFTPSDQSVYYRRYDITGAEICEVPLNAGTLPAMGKTPVVATEVNGTAWVLWRDMDQGFNRCIYLAMINSSCDVTYFTCFYNDNGAVRPTMASNDNGVWALFEMDAEIHHLLSNHNSCRISEETGISSYPSVGVDDENRGYAAWQDTRDGNTEIYYCGFSGCDNLTGDVRITEDPGLSEAPDIAVNAQVPGDWSVVWHDDRDGNAEIYMAPGPDHCEGMETWRTLTHSLPDSTRDIAAVLYGPEPGRYLYVSGGLKAGGTWSNEVLYAWALGDWTGPWNSTLALPDSVRDHRMVTVRDWIYALGGSEGAVGTPENPIHREVHDDVWVAQPLAGGSIASWDSLTALPVPLWGAGAAVWDDWIYVAGGSFRDSVLAAPSDLIRRAAVDTSNGSLGPWIECTARLPVPVTSFELLAHNGKLWAIGGRVGPPANSAARGVHSITIDPGGDLTSAWVGETALPEPRHSFGAGIGLEGNVYVVGGVDSVGYSRRTIYSANIDSCGSLSDWSICESGLPAIPGQENTIGVSNMAFVLYDCFLYSIGGYAWSEHTDHGFLSDVFVTQLLECVPTGVSEEGESWQDAPDAPSSCVLLPSSPNPFTATTTLRYSVPSQGAEVTVVIYDLSGRVVRTLVDGERQWGIREAVWNGRSDEGEPVASGVYFYRLETEDFSARSKVLLLR